MTTQTASKKEIESSQGEKISKHPKKFSFLDLSWRKVPYILVLLLEVMQVAFALLTLDTRYGTTIGIDSLPAN